MVTLNQVGTSLLMLAMALTAATWFLSPPRTSTAALLHHTTMKAAVYNTHGSPSVLTVSDTHPVPEYGPNDVVVRVHAASVNPVDYKLLDGFLPWWAEAALGITFPTVPGFDVAGEVVGVGAGVSSDRQLEFQVGARVYAMADIRFRGSFAEYAVVDAARLVLMPNTMSFKEAASIPLAGLTGWQALVQVAGLGLEQQEKPPRVLILGGSGGTGTLGIQIAKALGAEVTTTASPRNAELVRTLGADHVVDYRTTSFGDALPPHSFDIVYDCVGGLDNWEGGMRVLKAKGTYVTIVGDSPAHLGVVEMLRKGYAIATRTVGAWLGLNPAYYLITCFGEGPALKRLTQLVEAGALRAVVEREYQLDDVVQAFEASKAGKTRGKVVVTLV